MRTNLMLAFMVSSLVAACGGGGGGGGASSGGNAPAGGGSSSSNSSSSSASSSSSSGVFTSKPELSNPVPARFSAERVSMAVDSTPSNDGSCTSITGALDLDINLGAADSTCHVSGVVSGEMLEYKLVAEVAGNYDILLRVSADVDKSLELSLNGNVVDTLTTELEIPDIVQTLALENLNLNAGANTLQLKFNDGDIKVYTISVQTHEGALANNESRYWGKSGERFDLAGRLHDWSYAGYRAQAQSIPNVAQVANLADSAVPNDGVDDADALQQLIDTIPTPGAIFIPEGRWNIEKQINISRSGVVIRGEEGTEIYLPKSLAEINGEQDLTNPSNNRYSFGLGFFEVQGEAYAAGAPVDITQPVGKGVFVLPVSSTEGLSVGDLIEITQRDGPGENQHSLCEEIHGYLNELGPRVHGNDEIYPNVYQSVAYVAGIEGSNITIDRPTPIRFQMIWRPQIRKLDESKLASNVGFENFTIRGVGRPRNAHLREEGFNGIRFQQSINSWVSNIHFIDTDNGLKIDHQSNHITAEGLTFSSDLRTEANSPRGEVGHHAIWVVNRANYNLIKGFDLKVPYHHDLSIEGIAHLNVFMDGQGVKINIDSHRSAPWANLFTNVNVGDATRLWSSGGSFDRGPHSARDLTLWNVSKTSSSIRAIVNLDGSSRRREEGHNLIDYPYITVIGTKGLNTRDPERIDQRAELGEENIDLVPANLFEAQLKKRLEN